MKNLSDVLAETFVYFSKITASTWSINKIIPPLMRFFGTVLKENHIIGGLFS